MKFAFARRNVDLSLTKVIGVFNVDPADLKELSAYKAKALAMASSGVDFIELGVKNTAKEKLSCDEQADFILPLLRELRLSQKVVLGVRTSDPKFMTLAAEAGAEFFVDPNALKEADAAQTLSKLGLPVIICADAAALQSDPVSAVQDFFYERIDHCLNAGMKRRQIMLDPFYGNVLRADCALKLLGRIHALKSFALPLCLTVPESLPFDSGENNNLSNIAGLTASLYCAFHGVNLVRSEAPGNLCLALGTWQLISNKAKPYQLSKGIVRRFIRIRDAFKLKHKSN